MKCQKDDQLFCYRARKNPHGVWISYRITCSFTTQLSAVWGATSSHHQTNTSFLLSRSVLLTRFHPSRGRLLWNQQHSDVNVGFLLTELWFWRRRITEADSCGPVSCLVSNLQPWRFNSADAVSSHIPRFSLVEEMWQKIYLKSPVTTDGTVVSGSPGLGTTFLGVCLWPLLMLPLSICLQGSDWLGCFMIRGHSRQLDQTSMNQ